MWRQMLKTRLLSFSIITGLGLLLFVFLIVNGIFEGFMTKIQDTFGSAGSLVVLLLWIFYSSNILYFGAEFTKAYAAKYGEEIKPNDYVVTIKILEVESNKKSIQQNEKSPDPKRK